MRRAVFAGLASRMITGVGGAEAIAAALEAPSRNEGLDINARAFRIFAEQTKSDLKALAAAIRQALKADGPTLIEMTPRMVHG